MVITKRFGAKNHTHVLASDPKFEDQTHKPFGTKSETNMSTLYSLDIALSRKLCFCAAKGSSSWRTVFILLEISGHGVPWILGTLFAIYFYRNREQQIACNFLLALFLDLAIVGLAKVIFQRQRPAYNVMDMLLTVSVDQFSFPSGHSTRAAMVAGLSSLFICNIWFRILVSLWAVSVAISRVMLGRHHVSDVVCGVLIGLVQYWIMRKFWLSITTCHWILSLVPILDLQ